MAYSLQERVADLLYRTARRIHKGDMADRLLFSAVGMLSTIPVAGVRAKYVLGRMYAFRDDPVQAERWLSAALCSGWTGRGRTHYYLGTVQLAQGKLDAAATNLRTAVQARPDAHWYHLTLARVLENQGRPEEAEPYVREALWLNPKDPWYHFRLFQNLSASRGMEFAFDAWLDSVLATPGMDDPVIHPDWWLVHDNAYSPERVEKVTRILERHPRADDCYLLMAYLLRYSERPDRGVPYLRTASLLRWEQLYPGIPAASFATAKAPGFLVMGLAKSGSTAFYEYLCMHPLICSAQAKEINFWTDHYAAGMDWYRACFPPIPVDSSLISGEASIKTFWHERAPALLAANLPDMKLILILRDPVQRAFSEYSMMHRLGREAREWSAYVDEELSSHPECPIQQEQLEAINPAYNNYIMRSAVLPYLQRWLCLHDKGKFLIIQNEDLARDTTATMNRVFSFLDLPPYAIVAPPRINEGGYNPQPGELEKRLRDWYAPHQAALDEFLAREFS